MVSRARHFLLVCSSLGAGGAERVISTLANAWAAEGIEVTLTTFGTLEDDFYPLDHRVERVGLDLLRASRTRTEVLTANWKRVRALRSMIQSRKPQVVISFMDKTNVLVLLATRGLGVPVVVSERIDPRHYPIAKGWDFLRRITYRWAASLVVQTNSVASWARDTLGQKKVRVIPNPVIPPPAGRPLSRSNRIVAMGRLDRQKGFDLLIKAFAGIAARHSAWSVHIYGDGPERESLKELIAAEKMELRVRLEGRTNRPQDVLCAAEVFVLSSRFEGMPNVLLEAMSCGVACISFDCPSGPGEIIEQGRSGLLVPPEDVLSLAGAMDNLLTDPQMRSELGKAAADAMSRYSVGAVLQQWNVLLKEVV